MALVSFPKDYFEQALHQSLYKFFKGETTQDYNGTAFNTSFDVQMAGSEASIKEALETKKGVLNIELINDQMESKRAGCTSFDQEFDATTVTYAHGNVFKGTIRLRLVTDTREVKKNALRKDGLKALLDFKGIVAKILNENKRIPIYDFRPGIGLETITSLEIVHQTINRTYTEIPKAYTEVQEGVFDIPFYSLVFELDTYDRTTLVTLDPDRVFP